jgi:hypothetical protein
VPALNSSFPPPAAYSSPAPPPGMRPSTEELANKAYDMVSEREGRAKARAAALSVVRVCQGWPSRQLTHASLPTAAAALLTGAAAAQRHARQPRRPRTHRGPASPEPCRRPRAHLADVWRPCGSRCGRVLQQPSSQCHLRCNVWWHTRAQQQQPGARVHERGSGPPDPARGRQLPSATSCCCGRLLSRAQCVRCGAHGGARQRRRDCTAGGPECRPQVGGCCVVVVL